MVVVGSTTTGSFICRSATRKTLPTTNTAWVFDFAGQYLINRSIVTKYSKIMLKYDIRSIPTTSKDIT